jgi:hypothetical protein
MATVHNCDACRKTIHGDGVTVGISAYFNRFELCKNCAAPILAILKKHKLATA